MDIDLILKKLQADEKTWQPLLFDLAISEDYGRVTNLLNDGIIRHVSDDYTEQLKELFQINNPTLVYTPEFSPKFEEWRRNTLEQVGGDHKHGKWAFYPWISTLVHVLDNDSYQRVRMARNRNLITEEEQKRFYDSTIGIGGLSVGNSVALALVLQGGAKRLRLADFDRLGLSNLNRIRAGVDSLGLEKVKLTARQVYLLNPYAEIEIYDDGVTEHNLSAFFDGPPKLDVVIDELDTIPIKLLIRQEARKRKIPVVMGADNGDNAIIDIDRYDTDPQLDYFHGRLGEVTVADLTGLDKFGIGRTITKMLGAENITPRMQESLLAMGKTIVSWPQLGGAALLNGIGVAYCVRKILTEQPVENNRALLSLDEKMTPEFESEREIVKRRRASQKFSEMFGL